jgi:hypothetical protein
MLIQALYQYAKANDLGASPFEKKTMGRRLVIGPKGFVRFEKVDDEILVPGGNRTSGLKPYHLHDKAEYVLGHSLEGADRAKVRYDAFWAYTRETLAAVGDKAALAAVEALIADEGWLKKIPKGEIKGCVGIALEGDTGYLVEREATVKDEWRKCREKLAPKGSQVCAITGEACEAVRLHDRIQNVNGTGGATALISFNQKTATSGADQGLNFTVSFAALNSLLETNRASFGKTMCAVFWGPSGAQAIATVVDLYAKEEARVAAWEVVRSMADSREPLHFAFFKGSKSRIAVLNYDVVTTGDVVRELLRYHADFSEAIAERDRVLRRDTPTIMPSVSGNVQSAVPNKGAAFAELTVAEAVRNILLGRKLPRKVVIGLLHALRPIDIVKNRVSALWAMRWLEYQGDQGVRRGPREKNMKSENDLNEPQIHEYVIEGNDLDAYQLGRLVALSVSLKLAALGRHVSNDGAVMALGHAARSPASYLNRCTRDFNINSQKVRGRLVQLTLEVWRLIQTDISSRTTPLSLADTGALNQGYMHQTAYNRALSNFRRAVRKAKEEKNVVADAAE